jgi:hypothetical protein
MPAREQSGKIGRWDWKLAARIGGGRVFMGFSPEKEKREGENPPGQSHDACQQTMAQCRSSRCDVRRF